MFDRPHVSFPILLAGFLAGVGLTPLIGHTWPLAAFPLTGIIPALLGGVVGALLLGVSHGAAAGFVARLASREAGPVARRLAGAWIPLALAAPNVLLANPLRQRLFSGVDLVDGWALALGGGLLAAAFTAQALAELSVVRLGRGLVPLLATALAGLIYLRTMGTHVGQIDTFEFQVKAYFLGVSHPPGYPLYMWLNHAFAWLIPFGSVAWRVNLTAAIPAALTVGGVTWLARRMGADGASALLSTLTLAFSLTFWQSATAAEVYALNALLLVGALLAMDALLAGQRDRLPVYLLALALGLGVAHHLTILFVVPAAALAVLAARPRLTWRQWATAILIGAAGAALRLYIPLRWPALTGQTMSLADFVAFTTGQQFTGAVQWYHLTDPARWGIIGRIILNQFGLVGTALALLGALVTLIRRPLWSVLSLVSGALYLGYALAYNIPDIEVFLIPLYVFGALWLAMAVAALLGRWRRSTRSLLAPVAAISALALLPIGLLAANWEAADRSVDDGGEPWGRRVIAAVQDDAVILADSEKIAPLAYLNTVEGLGPGMDMVMRGNEAGYRESLYDALSANRPVYLARYLPGLEGEFYLRSAGPVIEVARAPLLTLPPGFASLEVRFGGEVALVGVRMDGAEWREGELAAFTLAWQRLADQAGRYEVRLRLRDTATDEVVWQHAAFAVGGSYPVNAWKGDEIVLDYYEVTPGYGLAFGGPYALEAGVFLPFAAEGIAGSGPDAWGPVATVTVWPALEPPPPTVRLDVEAAPGLVLLGYDAPDVLIGGDTAVIVLHWLALADSSYEVPVRWGDWAAHADLGSLARGDQRLSRLAVDVPELAEAKMLPLVAGHQEVAALAVRPAPAGLANFAGVFTLEAASLEHPSAFPGGTVAVTARWTAATRPEENYTVFVQAIGPDGALWGQVDTYPLHGTLATSTWAAGETIADRYVLTMRPDAPPGEYRVIIGFYLLRTSERLAVLDATGRPIGDSYTVGTVRVEG